MLRHRYSMIVLLITLSIYSCKEDPKDEILVDSSVNVKNSAPSAPNCPAHLVKEKKNNLNVSILLDLSDRIEEPKAIEKDIAYLASLSKVFTDHVKTKKLIMLEDRMQLFFNPEPTSSGINEIADNLKIQFTRETPQARLQETESLYSTEPLKLYTLAREDAGGVKKNYPGSDIWRFFKDNVKDYSMDNCHRNILVILTDGYMYYEKTQMTEGNRTSFLTPKSLAQLKLIKSNWKEEMDQKDLGFIPATKDLNDLEVLVIGINSLNDDNPYAQDIIEAYWSKWLLEMGVEEKNFKIKNAVIASNMEKVISDFIKK